jgi:hypothetical protein
MWAPHPDRGVGVNQTGSWIFSILCFMEEKSLTKFGLGVGANNMTDPDLLNGNKSLMQTPLAVLCCPTCRSPATYPVTSGISFVKTPLLSASLDVNSRTDYAGNMGEYWASFGPGPSSLPYSPSSYGFPLPSTSTGVIFAHNQFKATDIIDGTSKTYLAAEKYLNPDNYKIDTDLGDDQGPFIADERDSMRCTDCGGYFPPSRHRSGMDNDWGFGSAHPSTFNAVMCDGSVHGISYDISENNQRRLCNRKDKQVFEDPAPLN